MCYQSLPLDHQVLEVLDSLVGLLAEDVVTFRKLWHFLLTMFFITIVIKIIIIVTLGFKLNKVMFVELWRFLLTFFVITIVIKIMISNLRIQVKQSNVRKAWTFPPKIWNRKLLFKTYQNNLFVSMKSVISTELNVITDNGITWCMWSNWSRLNKF